jgi:hypothetical protein
MHLTEGIEASYLSSKFSDEHTIAIAACITLVLGIKSAKALYARRWIFQDLSRTAQVQISQDEQMSRLEEWLQATGG